MTRAFVCPSNLPLHYHWDGRIAGGVHCAECGAFVHAAWVRCQDNRPVCDPCYLDGTHAAA